MAATSNPTTRILIQRALLFLVFNSNLCVTSYSTRSTAPTDAQRREQYFPSYTVPVAAYAHN